MVKIKALVESAGFDFTHPSLPGDFVHGHSCNLVFGHFETEELGLHGDLRALHGSDGPRLKSGVWELLRVCLGDDLFQQCILWNIWPGRAHCDADSNGASLLHGVPKAVQQEVAELQIQWISLVCEPACLGSFGAKAASWVADHRYGPELGLAADKVYTGSVHLSIFTRANRLPQPDHYPRLGKLLTLLGATDGEACAEGLKNELGPAYDTARALQLEGCRKGGRKGGETKRGTEACVFCHHFCMS